MYTRILLADDHQMICAGLRKLLQHEPDFEVVAEARDGRSAVALAARLSPDVVVMDVSMPDLNGVEATRQIVGGGGDSGGVKVIALSGHSDQRFVSQMLAAGASGYLNKASAFAELVLAVQTVAAGRTYVSPAVTGGLVDDDVRNGEVAGWACAATTLSPREREVLQLLAEGKAMKQAAMQLHVSVKTVETHRRNLAEKLDLYSIAELTQYAIREGLTTVNA